MASPALEPFALQIFKLMSLSLFEYIGDMAVAISNSIGPFAQACLTLFLVVLGFRLATGRVDKDQLWDVVLTIVCLCFISVSIFNPDNYMNSVVKPFMSFILDSCAWFASKGGGTSFDDMFEKLDHGFTAITAALEKYTPPSWYDMANLDLFLAKIILGLSYGGLYIFFLASIIIPIFAIHILFVLGIPIFVFGAFKDTRFVFWAWIKTMANNTMIIILSAAVMSVGYHGVETGLEIFLAADKSFGIFSPGFAALVCWSIICLFCLLHVPSWAASLTGGMAGGSSGVAAGMGMVGFGMFAASKSLGGKLWGHTGAPVANKAGDFIKSRVGSAYDNAIGKYLKTSKDLSQD